MSKNKPVQKECSKSCCTSKSKSWLFIVKEFGETHSNQPAHIVRLRHPKTRDGALYMFSPENKVVQEILTFDEPKRSFFIGNEVKSDGRLFLSTPIDPLYLALPYMKEYGRCSPLDQILMDEEYPEIERLLTCSGLKYIYHIADQKGEDSLNAYLYNEEKALKWLEKKVKRVASALKEKGFHVSSNNAVSANFLINRDAVEPEDSYLRYAFGLVSDYLPESVTVALESHLNLPSEVDKKRKSSPNGTAVGGEKQKSKKKKINEEVDITSSPALPKEKKATPSAKEKAMAKAASGSKSITSFFKKK